MWISGLRYESATGQPAWDSNVGSLTAKIAGSTTFYQRLKSLGSGTTDFTAWNTYSVNTGGSLTVELSQVGLGVGGTFVEAAIDPTDPGGFEIDFGAPMAPVSGSDRPRFSPATRLRTGTRRRCRTCLPCCC